MTVIGVRFQTVQEFPSCMLSSFSFSIIKSHSMLTLLSQDFLLLITRTQEEQEKKDCVHMDWVGPWRGGQRGDWSDPWSNSPYTDLWDPFNYGGASWGVGDRGDETSALAHAHVDWRETDTVHEFRADLPGVRKEDLKVQVEDDNILQISGERVQEQEDKSDKWHRVERRRGNFMRRFRLPENANMEQIGCSLKNGVLIVTVPKKEMPLETKNVRQIDVA